LFFIFWFALNSTISLLLKLEDTISFPDFLITYLKFYILPNFVLGVKMEHNAKKSVLHVSQHPADTVAERRRGSVKPGFHAKAWGAKRRLDGTVHFEPFCPVREAAPWVSVTPGHFRPRADRRGGRSRLVRIQRRYVKRPAFCNCWGLASYSCLRYEGLCYDTQPYALRLLTSLAEELKQVTGHRPSSLRLG
jgi:hypothetical protein